MSLTLYFHAFIFVTVSLLITLSLSCSKLSLDWNAIHSFCSLKVLWTVSHYIATTCTAILNYIQAKCRNRMRELGKENLLIKLLKVMVIPVILWLDYSILPNFLNLFRAVLKKYWASCVMVGALKGCLCSQYWLYECIRQHVENTDGSETILTLSTDLWQTGESLLPRIPFSLSVSPSLFLRLQCSLFLSFYVPLTLFCYTYRGPSQWVCLTCR